MVYVKVGKPDRDDSKNFRGLVATVGKNTTIGVKSVSKLKEIISPRATLFNRIILLM